MPVVTIRLRVLVTWIDDSFTETIQGADLDHDSPFVNYETGMTLQGNQDLAQHDEAKQPWQTGTLRKITHTTHK